MKQRRLGDLIKIAPFIILFIGLFFSGESCTFNNEEDLYECDTLQVTYSNSVVPVLENNCYVCHGIDKYAVSGGGNLLEGYDNIEPYATGGILGSVINHDPGFVQMPRDAGKLSECDIAKVEIWIREGAENN